MGCCYRQVESCSSLSSGLIGPCWLLGVDELRDIVSFDEAWVVLDELFDSTGEQVCVLVASIDHGPCCEDAVALICDIHDDLLAFFVLEAVHLRDCLVLIDHHEGQRVGLLDVPGRVLGPITQVHDQVA